MEVLMEGGVRAGRFSIFCGVEGMYGRDEGRVDLNPKILESALSFFLTNKAQSRRVISHRQTA
jgi:hypothetical protein